MNIKERMDEAKERYEAGLLTKKGYEMLIINLENLKK